jgi:hypothetical protein
MVMGGDQTRDEGPVPQVDDPGLGSCQFLYLIDAAQGHYLAALDGHGGVDVPGSVGNTASVIHTHDLPVDQDGVRPIHLVHQGGTILGQPGNGYQQNQYQKGGQGYGSGLLW